jgi:hypothetical protein
VDELVGRVSKIRRHILAWQEIVATSSGAMLWSAAMMGLLVLGIGVGGAIEDRWIWPRRYRVEKVISVMVIVLFTTIALLGFA